MNIACPSACRFRGRTMDAPQTQRGLPSKLEVENRGMYCRGLAKSCWGISEEKSDTTAILGIWDHIIGNC